MDKRIISHTGLWDNCPLTIGSRAINNGVAMQCSAQTIDNPTPILPKNFCDMFLQQCCKNTTIFLFQLPLNKSVLLMTKTVEEILKSHDLRVTTLRSQILTCFQQQSSNLSQTRLEQLLDNPDRISVYRTLNRFVDSGLLHKVQTDEVTHYALCHGCGSQDHSDGHIHFNCSSCLEVICLDDIMSPEINLPKGYTGEEVNILVKGLCVNCTV